MAWSWMVAVFVAFILAVCTALPPDAEMPVADTSTTASSTTTVSSSAGAVFTEEVFTGPQSTWGHGAAGGAAVLPEGAVPRFNLLEGVRKHPPSEACRRALDDVLEASTQLRMWALKMQSSSVTLPDALLYASMYSLGDFDGCLSVPEAVYCLLDVEVRPARPSGTPPLPTYPRDEVSPFEPPHGQYATLWDLLQTSGNRRRYRRDLQQWAVCVPAACGPSGGQTEEAARQASAALGRAVAAAVAPLGRALAVELRLHLEPSGCSYPAQPENGVWAALQQRRALLLVTLFVLAFPVLVLLASVRSAIRECGDCGLASEKQGMLGKALDCFAVQRTWKTLSRHQSSQIHCIQGMRTLAMFCIILGHRLFYLIISGPVLNPEYLENSYTSVMKIVLVNGTGVVAVFFVISGFLEARTMMMFNAKQHRFTATFLLVHYAIRYLRLVPALAVALAIQTQWMQFMGSGPLWGQLTGKLVEDCQQNWWAHLLFVNNYQGTFCMVQTWFVASIVQMFLFTPPLMWLVSRWTTRALWPGCLLLGLLLAATVAMRYATTVRLGLLPTWLMYPEALRHANVATDPTVVYQYVRTHTNAVPYVVGLLAGTLFYVATRKKWQPSQSVVTLLWLGIPLTLALSLAIIFTGLVFYLPTFAARPLLDAAYGPARLLGYSLPTAWIICTCGLGHGGLFNNVLAWRPVVVLGRLTYSVYLMHLTFIMVATTTVRHPVLFSDYTLLSHTLADIVISYAVGLVLYFCVEAPMMNLQTIAFTYRFRKSISAYQTTDKTSQGLPVQEAPNASADPVPTST